MFHVPRCLGSPLHHAVSDHSGTPLLPVLSRDACKLLLAQPGPVFFQSRELSASLNAHFVLCLRPKAQLMTC